MISAILFISFFIFLILGVPIGAGCMILHFIEFCLDFCCKTDSAKNADNNTKGNMNTITTDKKEVK